MQAVEDRDHVALHIYLLHMAKLVEIVCVKVSIINSGFKKIVKTKGDSERDI